MVVCPPRVSTLLRSLVQGYNIAHRPLAKANLARSSIMTATEFETTLRELQGQTPFRPFMVEYNDGQQFWVDAPLVAYNGGKAAFMGPNEDFHFFDHKSVKRFLPAIT